MIEEPDPSPPIEPPGVEVAPGVRVDQSSLRFAFSRSGGPGGQNVNKVNTKVELWVPLTALRGLTPSALSRLEIKAGRRLTQAGELHISADTQRTQESNRQDALDRLRELLVAALHEPRRRRKTKPTRASKQRRLDSKHKRGQTKSKRQGPVDW
jgi:ribosome-associated protein